MAQPTTCSPLDTVLGQSLAAIARADCENKCSVDHLTAVLARIARYYRSCTGVLAQCVVEQGAPQVEIEGRPIPCARLLVQCARRDFITSRPLTLIYVPTWIDRITLRIDYGDAIREAADFIQWAPARNAWCVSGTSDELHGDSHAHFLRRALYEAGLFRAQTMTLEPLRG
ncbi:MAG: hypothetical protein DYH18_00965 [Xanthomonadales bacterium PRO7]|nr:hypothetical protein [Xanthomonadales bacterium PRO7]